MGIEQSFDRAMIEAFLADSELEYLRDRDGDFIIEFEYDEEVEVHPRFLLAIAGEDGEQYCLRGDATKRVPRADWDRVLRLCNEWNALYKMPKVYLEIEDPNLSTSGRVVCEQWLSLEAGLSQDLLNEITTTFFSACFGFWRWLRRQEELNALIDPGEEPETPDDSAGTEPE
ncbi:MAG: YbjN domain-containing protein [Isosphaeraceae bacterium]|nr:YbjN domain-containing protein [Isosphaeraceae bacterium]